MYSNHITPQTPEILRAIPAPYSFNDERETLDPILDNLHSTANSKYSFTDAENCIYTNFIIKGMRQKIRPRFGPLLI